MNTYTDEQLKRALAKMIPNKVAWGVWKDDAKEHEECLIWEPIAQKVYWIPQYAKVLDSELSQLCWEVEETLTGLQWDEYEALLMETVKPAHASWRQRIPALAAVKGIEL